MKDIVIFIAYYFPPYNVIASQRAAKIAIELTKINKHVIVLTVDTNQLPEKKIDLNFYQHLLANPNIEIINIPIAKFGYEDPEKATLFQKVISAFLTRIFCSNGIFWYFPLKRTLNALLAKNTKAQLFVSGSPFLCFYLAYKFFKKKNIQYILDYRDLWSDNPRTPYFKIARFWIKRTLEKKAASNAKGILTVSDGCRHSIKTIPDVKQSCIYVIRNLPDRSYKEDFYKYYLPIEGSSVERNIVFIGTIYSTCTFWPVLNALKDLDANLLRTIKVHYYGSSSKSINEEFGKYGLSSMLVDHGYVSKLISFQALQSAGLLISLVDDGKLPYDDAVAGIMTTKIFDYLLSGKPILNIGPVNCDVVKFASQINYANFYTFAALETNEIRQFIKDLFLLNQNQVIDNEVVIPNFEEEFTKVSGLFNSLGV
ncbi:hypothetical protein [Daejeonella sp.]|uniref:hypothetical protein n=1 Tax=Daejeonella sp. TaxID=2805397 RepID=UPI002C724B48|nr:hypothetical protein [Daejeonella sp.]HQT24834.1 hypothetical protein [Daejeonella sp.]HQT58827.1 hypothetical protein [Daejeonella sp.]